MGFLCWKSVRIPLKFQCLCVGDARLSKFAGGFPAPRQPDAIAKTSTIPMAERARRARTAQWLFAEAPAFKLRMKQRSPRNYPPFSATEIPSVRSGRKGCHRARLMKAADVEVGASLRM